MKPKPLMICGPALAMLATAGLALAASPGSGSAASVPAFPATPTFSASLSPTQAMPSATQAKGTADFFLSPDGTALRYVLTLHDIRDVTMAHLHTMSNGSDQVVAWLFPSAPPARRNEGEVNGRLASGVLTAASLRGPLAGKSLADLVKAIQAGEISVLVHTERHPTGALRGTVARAS